MSTVAEIEAALERLSLADRMEVRRWMDMHLPESEAESASPEVKVSAPRPLPDFLSRQRRIFGDRILPDSQAALDEVRAERF